MPDKLESATRGLIYTLIFFLPLFFFPLTMDALDVNKQALFLVLVFASALTWISSMLFSKHLLIQRGWINLFPLLFLIGVGVSAAYSSAPYLSWLGSSMQEYTSFLTLFGCVVLFYILVNAFRDRSTHRSLHSIILVSALIAAVIGLLSVFGIDLFSMSEMKNGIFNTVGSINALGVYLSVLSVFGGALYVSHRKDDALLHQESKGAWERLVIVLLWIVTVVFLIVVDYWMLWSVFLFGMSSLFVFGLFRAKDFERNGRMWLPAVSIMVALGFLVWLSPPINVDVPFEVTPSFESSAKISRNVIGAFPIYGSGPGTYAFDYALHHGTEVNNSDFWNTRFDRAVSYVYTIVPTFGYVGTGAFLLFFIVLFVRSMIQMLKPRSREEWLQAFVAFSPWATLCFAAFLYSFNMTLVFTLFLFTGLLGSQVIRKPYSKSYAKSPGLAFLFSLFVVSGSILLFIGIFISSERYIGEVAFARAIRLDSGTGSVQEVVSLLDTASTLNRFDDRYYRTLSEALLLRVGEQINNASNTSQLTAESRQYVQSLIAASVNASARATDLSPNNSLNWSTRGRVYRELVNVLPEASIFAIESHQKAVSLEPVNPRVWIDLGKTFLVAAEQQRAMTVVENKDVAKEAQEKLDTYLKQAESSFMRAIELKANYAPAHFQLGLTYERQGRLNDAISKLASIAKFNPIDVGVAFQLGQLYLRRDQSDDLKLAKAQFEHAVELSPTFSNARWFLASIYERLEEPTLAIEQIEKVLQLNPNNAVVKSRLERLLRGDQNEETVETLE